MRILLLCNKSPWPPKDGGAAATFNTINGLSACNVSVTVLAINTSKHFVNVSEIPAEFRTSTDYKLVNIDTGINPIKLIFNLIFSCKPYNLLRFRSKSYSSELEKILRNNFDIIQIDGLHMYHYLPVIRQKSSSPVVYRPYNIENLIWKQLADEESDILKRFYFRILATRIEKVEKDIINKVDAVIPISYPDLDWFKAAGLRKPFLVSSPGYFKEEVCKYTAIFSPKVFFIGALDWLPNIYGLKWFIREVWPIIIYKMPWAELFIAGRKPSGKTITEIRGQNIFFEGEVESSTEFIKDKAVMVVPLFSGSGIRMKIIEGMSQGKSIVATPVAAEGLIFENKTDIFIASGIEEFAEYTIELLSNGELRKKIGEKAINNVKKNYNILASSENLMNFYTEFTAC